MLTKLSLQVFLLMKQIFPAMFTPDAVVGRLYINND